MSNLYKPPQASLVQSSAVVGRGLRWFAAISGLVFLAISLGMEYLLRWQAQERFRKAGVAEDEVGVLVAEHMASFGYSLLISGIAGLIAIVAAILIRYRPVMGLRLLMLASAMFIGPVIVYTVRDPSSFHPFVLVRVIWWGCIFVLAYRAWQRLPESVARTVQ